jgi:hypothetical protein
MSMPNLFAFGIVLVVGITFGWLARKGFAKSAKAVGDAGEQLIGAGADAPGRLVEGLRKAFNMEPTVSIANQVAILETRQVAKLIMIEQTIETSTCYAHKSSIGSEKICVKKQRHTVAIGYDLQATARFQINEGSRTVLIEASSPDVLYVASEEPITVFRSDGVFNKLSDIDEAEIRNQLVVELHNSAQYKALLASRFSLLHNRFSDLLLLSSYKVDVLERGSAARPNEVAP